MHMVIILVAHYHIWLGLMTLEQILQFYVDSIMIIVYFWCWWKQLYVILVLCLYLWYQSSMVICCYKLFVSKIFLFSFIYRMLNCHFVLIIHLINTLINSTATIQLIILLILLLFKSVELLYYCYHNLLYADCNWVLSRYCL